MPSIDWDWWYKQLWALKLHLGWVRRNKKGKG